MKGIEFNIMFWEEDQVQLNNLGIRPKMEEVETRLMTFYKIDNISPYMEDGNEFTSICSGGDDYITNEKYERVKQILKDF